MVCEDLNDLEPEHLRLYRECYDDAVGDAVAQANRPLLTSLYESTVAKKG
jgi:hypothetical protein